MDYTYFAMLAEVKVRIKIGHSKDPERRLRQLQTGNGGKLVLGGVTTKATERELHRRFANCRVDGEWFDLTLEQLVDLTREMEDMKTHLSLLSERTQMNRLLKSKLTAGKPLCKLEIGNYRALQQGEMAFSIDSVNGEKATVKYTSPHKICDQLLPERIIDLRRAALSVFTCKQLQKLFNLPVMYLSPKDEHLRRTFLTNAILENPTKYNQIFIDNAPAGDVLKDHPNLLNSALSFRASVVDYFRHFWSKIATAEPNVSQPLEVLIDLLDYVLQCVEANEILINFGVEREIAYYYEPWNILLADPRGYQIVIQELDVALTSFFGLTKDVLTQITKLTDTFEAIEYLVLRYGRVILRSIKTDSLFPGRRGYLVKPGFYYGIDPN